MNIKICFGMASILICLITESSTAQNVSVLADSVWVKILPSYDSVGNFHRKLFGENYRKEFSMDTRLPIIRISQIHGGLRATQKGGGNQSKSVRLEDSDGNEWVLRNVEKFPEVLLPPALRESVAKKIIKDNMSAQHPFSALVVPVFAAAIGVPHSRPIIGWVAPDANLGEFENDFKNTVCLLEEREPLGKSDNSAKMLKKLSEENKIKVDAEMLLKLKALDLLLGDWDRHEDQWRWKPLKTTNGTTYIPIPRDRDQVFYRSDGKVQQLAQSSWFLPMMQGYEREIQNVNWFFWEGREINSRWFSELEEPRWDQVVREFCLLMTDELFERALLKLPEPGYTRRHGELLARLKERRAALPKLMNDYYRFFNRIVDIQVSDKAELVEVGDHGKKGLGISVTNSKAENQRDRIYQRNFDEKITREVRIYLQGGEDKVLLNAKKTNIRIRIIGGQGHKEFTFDHINQKTTVYNLEGESDYSGKELKKASIRLSRDTSIVSYVAKDIYPRHFIYPNFGFNNDDGLALGLNFRYTGPGFRKMPYGNAHDFSFLYSFRTSAFKFNYSGEWIKVFQGADVVLTAALYAPNNTQNFFGMGNETFFDESLKNISYYRARFALLEIEPSLRWQSGKSTFSTGPLFQYYKLDKEDNEGRFISNTSLLNSPDSSSIEKEKLFAGLMFRYSLDTRDNKLLPTKGIMLDIKLSGYTGLNTYSGSIGQIYSNISLIQKIDGDGKLILANRIGGGLTIGKPTFYQSNFLGGQGNLLGYRRFRFAGEHSLYNNTEIRLKLGEFLSYFLPGELGIIGSYDLGRVWKRSEHSDTWHHGLAGGLYFAPASLTVIRLIGAYSKEGWYPYLTMIFRY